MFLQVADIYTTYRGLKYDCVSELNPIIGEQPTIPRMMFVKWALLHPAIEFDRRNGNLTSSTMRQTNTFMALVVGNNMHVIQKADRYCQKK